MRTMKSVVVAVILMFSFGVVHAGHVSDSSADRSNCMEFSHDSAVSRVRNTCNERIRLLFGCSDNPTSDVWGDGFYSRAGDGLGDFSPGNEQPLHSIRGCSGGSYDWAACAFPYTPFWRRGGQFSCLRDHGY